MKNSARAVESLKLTNFVVPFVKNRWRRKLVCAQRPLEFDATPPIFQKRDSKLVNSSDFTAIANFFTTFDRVLCSTGKIKICNTHISFCKQFKLYRVLRRIQQPAIASACG